MDEITKLAALTLPQFAAAIALFLPGFVSLKVDRLIQPGKQASGSELIVDALAYSLLNAALLGWVVWQASINIKSSTPHLASYGLTVFWSASSDRASGRSSSELASALACSGAGY